MELGLSLGEAQSPEKVAGRLSTGLELGFSMGLGLGFGRSREEVRESERKEWEEEGEEGERRGSAEPPVQLNLLPLAPVPRQASSQLGFPWAPETRNMDASLRGFDVNQAPAAEDAEEGGSPAAVSPSSGVSSFTMDFVGQRGGGGGGGGEAERASSRVSDEEENGLARKKLRLSKEQSAFLEESFKEHNTLNPKQKLALAKQLNLRPRQVEVWFQNRRARTKLKQTEVDCEYLKRCCETLTEENRRLHKELAELRALKAAAHPFFSQLPATTLSMCPSCERVAHNTNPTTSTHNATTTTTTTNNNNNATTNPNIPDRNHQQANAGTSKPAATPFTSFINARQRFFPFAPHPAPPHQPSAAS